MILASATTGANSYLEKKDVHIFTRVWINRISKKVNLNIMLCLVVATGESDTTSGRIF